MMYHYFGFPEPLSVPVCFLLEYMHVTCHLGVRSGTVGGGTALQAGRSRVRFPMVSLEFFIDIILPAALLDIRYICRLQLG